MKKLGSFFKGLIKGGVVDSTPLSGIVEIIKGFDKKFIIGLLDTDGDGNVNGKDITSMSWEKLGKIVGMGLFLISIIWAAKALGLTELF